MKKKFCLSVIVVFTLVFSPFSLLAQSSASQIEEYRQRGGRFGLTAAQVAEVYSFIDRNQATITATARARNLEQRAFRAIVLELGLRNYGASPDELVKAIQDRAKQAAEYESTNARLRAQFEALADVTLRQPARAILDRADKAYAKGELERAQLELDALLNLRGGALAQSRDAYDAAVFSAMALASSRGDLETLDRIDAASERVYIRMEKNAKRARYHNKVRKAGAYYSRGVIGVDDALLLNAINIYRNEALPLLDRATEPYQWATIQNRLGQALLVLGTREGKVPTLVEAASAHRVALEIYEREGERLPLAVAMTFNNLGTALQNLGRLESGKARLEEAVQAHRNALTLYQGERAKYMEADTQNYLGSALLSLGKRESGNARLEEAVRAHRAALLISTRYSDPHYWAAAQNSLGSALNNLGERESGTEKLEEAISSYRAALTKRTRERNPLRWALTQNNLGTALNNLGERESDTERLEEAIRTYRAALMELPRDKVPLEWARTQSNLGIALNNLGKRESDTAKIEEAISAHRAALLERTRERVPLAWARTQSYLCAALNNLGERNGDTSIFDEAVSACRAALSERTRERVPIDWASTTIVGSIALAQLAEHKENLEYFTEAWANLNTARLLLSETKNIPLQNLAKEMANRINSIAVAKGWMSHLRPKSDDKRIDQ